MALFASGDLKLSHSVFPDFPTYERIIESGVARGNMEDDNEGLKDLILEELTRLGVQNTSESKASQGGSRLLTINYNTNASKSGKLKSKGKRSPRASSAKSPHTKQGHSKGRDDRKHTPKSPFAAAKRKAELRKQNAKEKVIVEFVFGFLFTFLNEVFSLC